jgi:hypothetical protein
MPSGMNYTKFLDYSKRFEKTKDKAKPFAKEFLKEQGQTLRALTVSNTPVDKGILKARWRLGRVIETGRGLALRFSNNMEYASFVEYGHRTRKLKDGSRRWVNGRFMLTIAQKRVMSRMQSEFTRAIFKFFRENGVR